MPVTNDNYDQLKIDKLKHFLETQAEKGHPKPFEIFVDNLKVVSRTEDPKEFDTYEFYMNDDTEKLRILIYNSNLSPRNDQYSFMVQKNKVEKGLNGLGEIESIVQEKLAARDREHDMNRLREELEATKEELQEAEEFSEKLQKEIEFLKENKFKLGNINLGELASVTLEGMLRRNPQFLSNIPGVGGTLAGIIEQDNQERDRGLVPAPAPTSTISFERETEGGITDDEKRHLAYLRKLEQGFTEGEARLFNAILGAMVEDPKLLPTIAELLNIKE